MTSDVAPTARSRRLPAVVASNFDGVAEIVAWIKASRHQAGSTTERAEAVPVPLLPAMALHRDVDVWARTTGRRP